MLLTQFIHDGEREFFTNNKQKSHHNVVESLRNQYHHGETIFHVNCNKYIMVYHQFLIKVQEYTDEIDKK